VKKITKKQYMELMDMRGTKRTEEKELPILGECINCGRYGKVHPVQGICQRCLKEVPFEDMYDIDNEE